jgi:catechol 2,3-dioxygenase-like lactoylglutathione lyase family enzyme
MDRDPHLPSTSLRAGTFVGFIPVTDLASARVFYVGTLGLTMTEDSPFAVVLQHGGAVIRLTELADLRPQPFTIAGWEVPDISAVIDSLRSSDVTFRRYDGMDQDDRGIWSTPGGDRVAWFLDPDGNTLSLTELA